MQGPICLLHDVISSKTPTCWLFLVHPHSGRSQSLPQSASAQHDHCWLGVLLICQIKQLAKGSLGFGALTFSAAANNPSNTPFGTLRPSDVLKSGVFSSTSLNEELFDLFDLLFACLALLIRVRDKEHDRQAPCVLRESVVILMFVGWIKGFLLKGLGCLPDIYGLQATSCLDRKHMHPRSSPRYFALDPSDQKLSKTNVLPPLRF